MADSDRIQVRLPKLPICPTCGVIAPVHLAECPVCGLALAGGKVHVPQVASHVWVAVRCSFQCRSCQFLSPLDELDIDGSVQCAQCGQAQRFDVGAWREALDFAHGVGDMAFPPSEGRHPHAAIWIGEDNPHIHVGSSRAFDEFRQSSVMVEDGVTIHRSLFIEAGPGHPVCAACRKPLEVTVGRKGTETRCGGCGEHGLFAPPDGAGGYCEALAGVVAEAHRADRKRARVETSAGGPMALKCPDCGGALPATRERVVSCGYCGVASLIPAEARTRDAGQVLKPDVWWVAFSGPSDRRKTVEIPPPRKEQEPKDKAEKLRAKLTDLELAAEKPGTFWPQVTIDLLLPTAALVVAIVIWFLLRDVLPTLPTGPDTPSP